jgi:hypothetical protein
MTTAVAPLVREVEARMRRDSGFAEVLDALLKAPSAPRGRLERVAADGLNRQRRAAVTKEFVEGAYSTSDVQSLLGFASPQAVHQLRRRGKLLGAPVGNQTWFPIWQFDGDRLLPDLPRILDLLAQFTSDAVSADRVMRIAHDEIGGASIADALRQPDTAESAWQMLTALGA